MKSNDYVKEHGFVLLDICMAAFLCVAIVSLLAGYQMIARAQRNSEVDLTAVFLASEQLAKIKSKGNAYISTQSSLSMEGGKQEIIRKNNLDYKIETTIVSESIALNLYRVIIHISWQDEGVNGERKLERIVYASN